MPDEMSVSVDRDFARFGKKSYAINKINSVEVRERYPHGQGPMFAWGVLALICVLSGFGYLTAPAGFGTGVITFLVAGIFGFLAYRAWLGSKIVEYQLFLMTSSSEAQAIVSHDGDMIKRLRDRIERAMAGRLT